MDPLGALIGGITQVESAKIQAEVDREANVLKGRELDLTQVRDRRDGDRADRVTQHEMNQDLRRNKIEDAEIARRNKIEDEELAVVRKQRGRDEKKFQTVDENDFIIQSNFIKKAGAMLKQVTFGEYNIVIASGTIKDKWEPDTEGELLSDVIGLQLTDGSSVKYKVRVFDTGTLRREGSQERDAFLVWPKRKQNVPAVDGPPASSPPAKDKKDRPPSTKDNKERLPVAKGVVGASHFKGPLVGGLFGQILENDRKQKEELEKRKKKEEEEEERKKKKAADEQKKRKERALKTFSFEEHEKSHTEKQILKRIKKHKALIEQQLDEIRGETSAGPLLIEDIEEEEPEELAPASGRKQVRGSKGIRPVEPAGEEFEEDLEGDFDEDFEEDELQEQPAPRKKASKRTKKKARQTQFDEHDVDEGDAQDEEDEEGGEDEEDEEVAPAPKPRKKSAKKKRQV